MFFENVVEARNYYEDGEGSEDNIPHDHWRPIPCCSALPFIPQNEGIAKLHTLSSSLESDEPNATNPDDHNNPSNNDNNEGYPPPREKLRE